GFVVAARPAREPVACDRAGISAGAVVPHLRSAWNLLSARCCAVSLLRSQAAVDCRRGAGALRAEAASVPAPGCGSAALVGGAERFPRGDRLCAGAGCELRTYAVARSACVA